MSRAGHEATVEQEFLCWRQHGDTGALGRVFDRLAPELLIVAAHIAGRGEAEDLVQGAFVTAITQATRWDPQRALMPWLVGILANLSRHERERARRPLDAARLSPPRTVDPRDEAEREETARLLATALQGMPRHYRHVLTLRLVHGLEPAAIAHALGAPPATVKSRLQRGIAMLQRALPAGLRLAAVPWPVRSMATVREAVLQHASSHALAASAAVASLTIGGALMTKKVLVASGLVIAAALAFATPSMFAGHAATGPGSPPADAHVAVAPPPADEATPAARDERVVVAASAQAPAIPAPAAGVRGRVVDTGGQPLPDVFVLLGDQAYSPFRDQRDFTMHMSYGNSVESAAASVRAQLQRTGADGTFVLDQPPNERPHLLVACSEQRGCRAMDLTAIPLRPFDIVLPEDPVASGIVRNRAAGTVIAGASVQVWPERSGMPVSHRASDATGRYRLQPLPPGRYRVEVEAEGFATQEVEFTLVERQRDQLLDLELAPLQPFRFQLVDAGGQPWTSARIWEAVEGAAPKITAVLSARSYARMGELEAESWTTQPLRFAEDGNVSGFVRDPALRVLTVWSGGEKVFEVPDVDPTAARLVVAMVPRATIALQVEIRLDPPVEPAPAVHLSLTDPSSLHMHLAPIVTQTTTAATCRLPAPANFAGRACGLLVQCEGRAPYFALIPVPDHADDNWHRVVLAPGTRVTGVVVGIDGKPVANGSLQLADVTGNWFLPPRSTRQAADQDGAFAFPDVPRQRARLFVAADGWAARAFEIDTGHPEPLRIELRPGRRVAVRWPPDVSACQLVVRDPAGQALADDRLAGARRYGGGELDLDPEAASIEAFDAVSGSLVARGPVPQGTEVVLQAVGGAAKATGR